MNIPWPSSACPRPSTRPGNSASWATKSCAPASTSTSRSARAPAPLSAAKKPPSLPPSKAIIGEPTPRPPYPVQQGSSACPPSSTTSKPGPTSLKSSTWGRTGSRPSAPKTARAPRSSLWWGRSINTGLVEVPMGTTLRQIIFDLGGGIPQDREFKAVQTGGPSGGCIPGRIPGPARGLRQPPTGRLHHGLRRHDRHGQPYCMVDVARYFISFLDGGILRQMHPLPGRAETPARPPERNHHRPGERWPIWTSWKSCAAAMACASLCGLGQSAANPVRSHPEILPGGIRDPYPGQEMPCPGLPAPAEIHHRSGNVHQMSGLCPGMPGGRHQRPQERSSGTSIRTSASNADSAMKPASLTP